MQNLPDAVLLIVGDGPERAALEQQAQSLGVADRVIFVGAVPPAQVPRYYALGDVFVSASTSEAHIPEFSFLASKSDLHDLHFHPVVPDLGEKPEKAADGRVFPITVLSSLSPVPPL